MRSPRPPSRNGGLLLRGRREWEEGEGRGLLVRGERGPTSKGNGRERREETENGKGGEGNSPKSRRLE